MLESLIVNILNKSLSNFIENLDSKQLDISLFSGKAELQNLTIRHTLLDNLPLPFKIEYGRIGYIKLDIPITSLSSKPLKVKVVDVAVILKVKSIDDWKQLVEIDAYQNFIIEALDIAEKADMSTAQIKKKNAGYFDKLIAKVIDNVQLNVHNLYVRLEDTISYPDTPWAMGFTLAELTMNTNSSSWLPKFVTGEDLMRKSLKIRDVGLFLNYGREQQILFSKFSHKIGTNDPFLQFGIIECNSTAQRPQTIMKNNFIIKPFEIEAHLTLNKNLKSENPQLQGFLVFGGTIVPTQSQQSNFSAQIDQTQLSVLLKLAEYIGLYVTFKEAVLSQFFA